MMNLDNLKVEDLPLEMVEDEAPTKASDYYRIFNRYISKKYLHTMLVAAIIAAAAYLSLLHPEVVKFWYSHQNLPKFKLDSPYLTDYSGKAQLLLADNSLLYEGEIANTVIEGDGKLYQNGVLIYQGSFFNNKYNGSGKFYDESGQLLYDGDFVDNLYSGKGVLYYTDGTVKYTGTFENGIFQGGGKLNYTADEATYTYTGEFEAGLASGNGELYTKGTLLYEGEFANGLYNGYGKLYQGNTLLYVGEFVEGLYNGSGKLYQGNTPSYVGDFVEGLYEGSGKLYKDGSLLYVGDFEAGLYNGSGKLYENSTLLYDGEFLTGLYNGNGIEYDTQTGHKAFEGKYLLGERMESGTEYDNNGETAVKSEQWIDPVSLLLLTYEDVCAKLAEADISCRVVQALERDLLLIDDAGSNIYAFTTDATTGNPLYLKQVYLCSLYVAGDIVVGSDISQVSLDVQESAISGRASSSAENYATVLANSYWGESATMSQLGSITYTYGDYLLTAYYIPSDVASETNDANATTDKNDVDDANNTNDGDDTEGTDIETLPEQEEVESVDNPLPLGVGMDTSTIIRLAQVNTLAGNEEPSGTILFLRVERTQEGSGK